MPALAISLRNTLETLVVKARDAAEAAAEAALKRLAVHETSAYSSMGEEARRLRRLLRGLARPRQRPHLHGPLLRLGALSRRGLCPPEALSDAREALLKALGDA